MVIKLRSLWGILLLLLALAFVGLTRTLADCQGRLHSAGSNYEYVSTVDTCDP
jgi:hypothetical protein